MVWAIGDIQGCYKQLRVLLEKIHFDPKRDTLWLAGDLVNRGEGSLETLEYLYSIRKSVVIVLGNHDMMLIAAYAGIKKSNPSIDPILKSPHAKKLISWLRSQQFLHTDPDLGYCMSHSGISPEFDLRLANNYAKRIEKELRSNGYKKWLSLMFDKGMDRFNKKASKTDKERYILSSFIRMRYCYNDGRLEFKQKGTPSLSTVEQKELNPWFVCPVRKKIRYKIIFGHWATLGYYNDDNVCCLDSGCVWGKMMTAIRLDNKSEQIVQVQCERTLSEETY